MKHKFKMAKHGSCSDKTPVAKMIFYAITVGIIAGIGAVLFLLSIEFLSAHVLSGVAGYSGSHPAGEVPVFKESNHLFNPILLVLVTTLGGLASGFLVYTFAPEAEGHGTDGAIDAYHNKRGIIKPIVPIIKMVASAITLGTGGSGGREGPIAQIGAGFGSFLGMKLKLSAQDRRILLLCGMGSGIGAIFHSPMAGAIFGVEVLYRDLEMESEAFIYSIIASIVAYSVFSGVFGWHPLFNSPTFKFTNILELIPYTVLAVAVGAFAVFYVTVFYGVRNFFRKIPIKPHFKPAIGGLLVGLIGIVEPNAISTGYGFLQNAMWAKVGFMSLFAIAVLKVFATSFTISSGGSAGVFGPSMVIGGALGGAAGMFSHFLFPSLIPHPGAFVLVGMAGFFSAAANTPLSTIIMVTEMVGDFQLVVPALWVSFIAYILAQRSTIYEKQVKSRPFSSAHKYEYMQDVLQTATVGDLMEHDFITIDKATPMNKIYKILSESKQTDLFVVDENNELTGILTLQVLKSTLGEEIMDNILVAGDLYNESVITATKNESAFSLIHKIGFKEINTIPVVDYNNRKKIIGIVRRKNIIKAYDDAADKLAKMKHTQ